MAHHNLAQLQHFQTTSLALLLSAACSPASTKILSASQVDTWPVFASQGQLHIGLRYKLVRASPFPYRSVALPSRFVQAGTAAAHTLAGQCLAIYTGGVSRPWDIYILSIV